MKLGTFAGVVAVTLVAFFSTVASAKHTSEHSFRSPDDAGHAPSVANHDAGVAPTSGPDDAGH
ncbi:MAG: hypothetical protein U0169_17980 [Polyangiaceae bacterium]